MRTANRLGRILFFFLALVVAGCRNSADTPLTQASVRGDVAQVRVMVAQGVGVDDRDGNGLTALMWAGRYGHTPVVKALIEMGADPNARDRAVNGWTALIHAIHKNQNEAARALIEGAADPNVTCDGGVTALMYAAAYGNTEMVRALLAAGADPRAEASGGVTALWNAAGGGALFDFTDGPSLGTCYPETAQALLEKAPDLKLRKGLSSKVVKALGRSKECSELLARLETP